MLKTMTLKTIYLKKKCEDKVQTIYQEIGTGVYTQKTSDSFFRPIFQPFIKDWWFNMEWKNMKKDSFIIILLFLPF